MTERLALLLRQEADTLDVPAPDAAGIVGDGRRLRRRRRAVEGVALVAVVAAVGAIAVVVPRIGGGSSELPAASAAELEGWAVASGSTVQLGTGQTVHVDGKVKSVYYTSAGVLVRAGAEAATDAPDSTYTLVDADGQTSDFALELGDRVPGTDPTQPYLAYAEKTDDPGRWDVVLRDVRTGDVYRNIPVNGTFTWGGWVAPPVALSGSHVYVGLDDATLDIAWKDATVTRATTLPASNMPTVAGGRVVLENDRTEVVRVVDAQTGEVLLELPQADRLLSLSPDGTHAIAVPWRSCDDEDTCTWDKPTAIVYDLATGRHREIDIRDASYGWTPAGDLLRVDQDSVDVCQPDTAICHSTPVTVHGRSLRLGGTSYES